MKTLSKQDITDMLYGCTVLGTGGGGRIEDGFALLEKDFAEGLPIRMVTLDEIPDTEYVATPYGCGAPRATGEKESEEYAKLPHPEKSAAQMALEALEDYMGIKFYAISCTELGGANTAEALHIAAQMGLPIVDGDPTGRSVPELQHQTYFVKGIPIYPMGVASAYGDKIIISEAVDDFRAESLVRALAVASDNMVGVADHPITGKLLKDSIIPGSLTMAIDLGRAMREAQSSQQNVANAIAQAGSGKIAFTGIVSSFPWETRDGFNIGEVELTGTGDYTNQTYKLWFKNENIISWRNGEVDTTIPDLICILDKTGTPLTTPNYQVGDEITVLILPAPQIWRSPAGIACFGPRNFGFDTDYIPAL